MSDTQSKSEGFLSGTILGNYRLLEKIGEGAHGSVYKAEHIALGIPYAVKLLHPSLANDESACKRFNREAKSLGRLRQENIVLIADYSIDLNIGPYLVMEYLEGETLETRLSREGALPFPLVKEIARKVGWALGAAHELGMIHRDVKPENVFLIPRGSHLNVKILDFGIVRLLENAEVITNVSQTLGTPYYMAPEQCQKVELSLQTDIYSFGIMLYKMLTGIHPFPFEDAFEVMTAHLIQSPPLLPESFPKKLRKLVSQMVEKKPSLRPISMSVIDQVLESISDDAFPDLRGNFPLYENVCPSLHEQLNRDNVFSHALNDSQDSEETQPDLMALNFILPPFDLDKYETLSELSLDETKMSPNQMDHNEERKKSSRQKFTWMVEVDYQNVNEFLEECGGKVSKEGLFIHTDSPKEIGDFLFFRFRLDDKQVFEGFGIIQEIISPEQDDFSGMHIQFTKLDTSSMEILNDILSQVKMLSLSAGQFKTIL